MTVLAGPALYNKIGLNYWLNLKDKRWNLKFPGFHVFLKKIQWLNSRISSLFLFVHPEKIIGKYVEFAITNLPGFKRFQPKFQPKRVKYKAGPAVQSALGQNQLILRQ